MFSAGVGRNRLLPLHVIPETDDVLPEQVRLLSLALDTRLPVSQKRTLKPLHVRCLDPGSSTCEASAVPAFRARHNPKDPASRGRALLVLVKWFLRIVRRTSLRNVFVALKSFQCVKHQGALRIRSVACEEYDLDEEPLGSPPPLPLSTDS